MRRESADVWASSPFEGVRVVAFVRPALDGRSSGVVQVARNDPNMAGAAFLLPGLLNGYGKLERTLRQQAEVLETLEGRLTRIELGLGIETNVQPSSIDSNLIQPSLRPDAGSVSVLPIDKLGLCL